MSQDGFSSSEPLCIQVVNGETFKVLQMQRMSITNSSKNHSEINQAFSVGSLLIKNEKDNLENHNDFLTSSNNLRPSEEFSENVLSVPIQFVQLSQNSSFFSNLPEGTQLQFDVDRKLGKLSSLEVVDKLSDDADLDFQSNGQVIIRYNEDGSKNYLLDSCNLNMLIADNEEATFVEDTNINNNFEDEDSGLISGQLMVTKLVKECDESDDIIPDSRTITINNNQQDHVLYKSDCDYIPANKNLVCPKCNISFINKSQLKKHSKKHEEDRPYQCPVCAESFNFERNLNLHLSIHNSGELKCPECGKTFRRLASFKAHLSIHKEDEIITCQTCGEEFFSMFQLYTHQYEKHTSMSQSLSNALISKNIKLEPADDKNSFLCQKCGTSCASSSLLKEHMFQHIRMKKLTATKPKQKFIDRTLFDKKCLECGKCFLKPSQLLRHLRIHTGERPFKCSFKGCGRAFNQRGTLLIHMNIHSGKKAYICELCNKGFVQKSNLRGHLNRVHPISKGTDPLFSCLECPCVFRKSNSLNAHISKVHMSEAFVDSDKNSDEYKRLIKQLQEFEDNRGKVIVSKISKVLENVEVKSKKLAMQKLVGIDEDILQQALKNSGVQQAKYSPNSIEKNQLNTEVKQEKLQRVKMVTVIERMHEGSIKRYPVLVRLQENIKWYVCDFDGCTKEFKKPSDLVRHIRTHTNEKPYQCKKCQRAFSIKATLMGHMKTHLDEKEHSCHVCDKKFSTAATLRTHSWVHTGVKPYKCTIGLCGKSFRTISHKKAHILSHTQSAYRMHALKKKSMPLPDIPLQEPILITNQGPVKQTSRFKKVYSNDGQTSGDRPHICRFCSGAFKKSSHLKQHERIHTGEKPFKCDLCVKAFGCRSILKSHLKTHSQDRNYSCIMCLKGFASKGSLTRHYSTHSSNRPYLCPYCHKTFKTSTNCKKHMKTHKQELAMEAIRSAGVNLQGDSEQAVLTSDVFGTQNTDENQNVSLRITDNSICVEEQQDSLMAFSSNGKEDSIITFSNGEAAKIEFSKGSIKSDSGFESPIHIQATYTQDLLNGNITLSNFQKKSVILPSVNSVEIKSHPPCSFASSQQSIIISSSQNYNDHSSKILIPSTNDLISQHETNEAIIDQPVGQMFLSQEGVLFETIENLRKDDNISHTSLHTSQEPSSTLIQKQNMVESLENNPNDSNMETETSVHSSIDYTLHAISSPIKHLTVPEYESEFKFQRTNSFCEESCQLHIDSSQKSFGLSSAEGFDQIFELTSPAEVTVHRGSKIDIKEKQLMSSNNIAEVCPNSQSSIQEDCGDNNEVILQSSSAPFSLLIKSGSLHIDDQGKSVSNVQIPSSVINVNIASTKETRPKGKRKMSVDGCKKIRTTERKSQGTTPIKMESIEDYHKKIENIANAQIGFKHMCSECGKTYQKAHHLKVHMKWHNTPAACKQCGETFSNSAELKEHQLIHKRKTCNDCKIQFLTPSELVYHNRKVHNKLTKTVVGESEPAIDKKMWHCPVCHSLFNSCEATQEHLVTHSQQEISLAISNERKQEIMISESRNETDLKLEIPTEAVQQMLQEAEVENISDSNCKLQIDQSMLLDNTTLNVNGFYSHHCPTCGKYFKKPSDLTRHIRTHTGEKPYECSTCSKKFAVKSTLDVHRRIHSGKKEYKCLTCKTMYSSKGSLKVHMRLHTGAKPLKCSYCCMKFRTSGHRKAHVAKHFKVKDGRFLKNEIIAADTAIINPNTMYVDENLLASSVDGNEEINSVMINPDGTVTLQINGVSLSGLEPSTVGLLNLQPLADSVFDHVQFCSTESLEVQSSSTVEDVVEDSLSVNPNVVMTRRDSVCSNQKLDMEEKSELEVDISGQEHNIIVLQNSDLTHGNESVKAKNLTNVFTEPYFSSISSNDLLSCNYCDKSFSSSSGLEEHLKIHSLNLKSSIAACDVKNKGNLKSVSKISVNKVKIWRCPYPNCPLSFQSEKDYQIHMDTLHNINYECSECKEVFLSQSSLQHHFDTEHYGSKSLKCTNCRHYFNTKEELVHHTSVNNSQCSLLMQVENCYKEKNADIKHLADKSSSSRILLVDNVRESLDEDSEPLMIRDIFLSQS